MDRRRNIFARWIADPDESNERETVQIFVEKFFDIGGGKRWFEEGKGFATAACSASVQSQRSEA